MNTTFQLASNGGSTKDWFGVNTLNLLYERFNTKGPYYTEYNKYLSEFENVMLKMPPDRREVYLTTYQFLVENTRVEAH